MTRRRFLASATATLVAASAAPAISAVATTTTTTTAPAPRLNIAIVGVGGRGADHVREVFAIPTANIVALCDVDVNNLVQAARKITQAATFVDFREMLKMPGLDAVLISTPDHTHAVITAAALRAGKHVYCEKPLTHTIRDARAITQLAKETGLVTQMGIQIHAMDNYRRVVELVQSGAIGSVSEVHIWNNRMNRAANPAEAPPPATLNYDLWLGPVTMRPFRPDYHPYSWRRWWAFGEGMLGDIGCHLMDVAFWALELKSPTHISADGAPRDEEITTEWIVAKYDFAARKGAGGDLPPVKLTWYDPPKTPEALKSWNLDAKLAGEGVMFIGSKGMLFTNYGQHALLPVEKFKTFKRPTTRIASSPGHQCEWIDACLKKDPAGTSTPFSYGGLLTEAALLGTIAFRAEKPLEWDAANMRFPNAPDAEEFLSSPSREGWAI